MLVIDRFENGYAVCENEEGTFRIPKEIIAPCAKEGDVLDCEGGTYKVNAGATEHRRLLAKQKLKRLLAAQNDTD